MNSSKIITLIRKLVIAEVRKTSRKMIRLEVRKIVKPMINEILAEQFFKTMGQDKNQKSLASSVLEEGPRVLTDEERIQKRLAFERIQMQKKIDSLTEGSVMNKLIYGNLEESEIAAQNQVVNAPEGAFVDMGDEGVDLSQFGY